MSLKQGVFIACATAMLVFGIKTSHAQSDDDAPVQACEEAVKLYEENDIDGALEEAKWCVESLSEIKRNQTLRVFPDVVAGYTGAEIDSQNVLGMTVITRNYSKASKTIEVSLTGGGAAASGLAALAQMGINLSGEAGTGKKLRIQRRTVFDSSDAKSVKFVANLRSGGMLNFASENGDKEETLTFIKAFPIIELDDALRNN